MSHGNDSLGLATAEPETLAGANSSGFAHTHPAARPRSQLDLTLTLGRDWPSHVLDCRSRNFLRSGSRPAVDGGLRSLPKGAPWNCDGIEVRSRMRSGSAKCHSREAPRNGARRVIWTHHPGVNAGSKTLRERPVNGHENPESRCNRGTVARGGRCSAGSHRSRPPVESRSRFFSSRPLSYTREFAPDLTWRIGRMKGDGLPGYPRPGVRDASLYVRNTIALKG
jgi:hypothetical protein